MKDKTDKKTEEMFHDMPHVAEPDICVKYDQWYKDGCRVPFWDWLKEDQNEPEDR